MNKSPALVLCGDVDAQMSSRLLTFLLQHQNKHVVVYLNTEGGETLHAKEIMEMIKEHGRVSIIAFGECASAGTLILCSSEYRYGTKDCKFMIHFGEETATSLKEKKELNREYKWYKNVYDSALNASKRTISRWVGGEKTFTADEAQKWDLIKKVVPYGIRGK